MVLNDQIFPSHSKIPRPPVSLLEFAGKLKAAQDGLKTSSVDLIVKLDGIRYYGISGIKERIRIASKLGVEKILIGHLETNSITELKNRISLADIGLAQDNELISRSELEQAEPAFIIATAASLICQKKIGTELVSRLEEIQYENI